MDLRPVWSSRIRFFLTYLKTVNIVSAAMSQLGFVLKLLEHFSKSRQSDSSVSCPEPESPVRSSGSILPVVFLCYLGMLPPGESVHLLVSRRCVFLPGLVGRPHADGVHLVPLTWYVHVVHGLPGFGPPGLVASTQLQLSNHCLCFAFYCIFLAFESLLVSLIL